MNSKSGLTEWWTAKEGNMVLVYEAIFVALLCATTTVAYIDYKMITCVVLFWPC